jgi:Amt family ammonium transporter
MPLFGLGVIILWLGWFGFNPGSTLGAMDGRFPEVALVTLLAAGAGVLGAIATARWKTGVVDIGMAGNGAIGALVAITAPSGYVEAWTAPIIGLIAGIIVPLGVYAIDKKLDDPVGALTAHGLCGVWGTLSCGIFTSPRLAEYNAFGSAGIIYNGSFEQIGRQALGVVVVFTFVFALSYATFWAIKKTYGLRVEADHEDAGLDISEHGMYGYPEQFIPAPELIGYTVPPGGAPREPRMPAAPASARERYRGAELTNWLRPKVKIECVVASPDVKTVVDVILRHARTGEIGDGKVFVMPVEEAYRIRTGESGEETLQAHPEVASQAGV